MLPLSIIRNVCRLFSVSYLQAPAIEDHPFAAGFASDAL